MNFFKLLAILVLILNGTLNLYSAKVELIPIRSIGDERDDYTFFIPVGAVLSPNKSIYVLDGKGFFLSQYDWEGNFIARTGTKGKGPGDFFYPRSLQIYNNKLFILDKGNHRIAETDLSMNSFDYFKIDSKNMFDSCCYPLKNGEFLGNFTHLVDKRGRLGIVDKNGKIARSFFNKFPVDINFEEIEYKIPAQTQMHKLRVGIETLPVLGVDEKNENLLISFRQPDNPVVFYVYSLKGEPIKTFKYEIKDKKYKISQFAIKASWEDILNPKKYPKERHSPFVDSLFIFKKHFVVFLVLEDYQRKALVKQRRFCLIFNPNGVLLHRIEIDSNLRIFSISKEAYVLGTKEEEDISKIYIFKLNL